MGLTFSSVCVKCGVEAPEVGDFGYIGTPSLDGSRRRGDRQTFGFIYAGLAAIGALTQEIEAFKAFLDEHGHHTIRQYNDIGEEDFSEEEESGEEPEAPPRTKKFAFKKRGFAEMFYELQCETCEATYRSSSSERLPAFKPIALTPARIALFRSNAASVGDENFYHVGGFPFDDLQHIDRFLTAHAAHAITARRTPGEVSTTPEGLRGLREAEPRPAPEWPPEANEKALGSIADSDQLRVVMKLRHRDPAVRREAALEVSRLAAPGFLGYLVSLWLDPEPSVRAVAVAASGSLKDPRAIRPLGQALLDESEAVRSAARAALGQLGVSEELALGESRSPRGPYNEVPIDKTQSGLQSALRDPRGSLRYRALEALDKSRETWAADLLLLGLADPKRLNRSYGAAALAQRRNRPDVVDHLIAALDEYGTWTVSAAAKALGKLKAEAAIPRIRELLLDSTISYWDTAEALEEIGSKPAAEALADALTHSSPDVRGQAAWRLGRLKATHLADRLVEALSDSAEEVRVAAAQALEQMKDPAAVEGLVRAFQRPSEWDRRAAVAALAQIGGDESLRVLVAALQDPSRHVRSTAASALEKANSPRGNRALLAAARAGDSVVALHAWQFLVGEGAPGTEKALVEALDDEGYESAHELAGCLLQCGNRQLEREARRWLRGARPLRGTPKIRWGERRGSA